MLSRRDLIKIAPSVALLPWAVLPSSTNPPSSNPRIRLPFVTLYNNDGTNLIYCVSPWNNKRNNPKRAFTDDLIEGSVNEVAGLVDVQLFCPGLCWVPWWTSQLYPAKEHYRWYNKLMGLPVDGPYDSFGNYLLAGGDMIAAFLKECRARQQTAFVTFRLNDVQFLKTSKGKPVQVTSQTCRFWYEHPSFTLGTDWNVFGACAQNWAIQAVVQYKLELIKELCLNYDIDGLDLDFMRFPKYFPIGMDLGARREIMKDFVVRVRALLDQGARKHGRPRYLSARIPAFLDNLPELGIDLPAFVDAGLDMITLSNGFFTVDDSDLPRIREILPYTALYLEATQTPNVASPAPNGAKPFLRTTAQQFHTAANVAYHQGAQGMSLFNFAYYRQTVGYTANDPGVIPFNEPPFDVLPQLRDRAFVAQSPQWYVLAVTDISTLPSQRMQLPYTLQPGANHTFTLPMYPTSDNADAVLRLRTEYSKANTASIQVELNNQQVGLRVEYIEDPLPDPFAANDAIDPTRFFCYRFKTALIKPGSNEIKISLSRGSPVRFDYLDVSWA